MQVAVMGPGATGLYLLSRLTQAPLAAPWVFDHDKARLRRLFKTGFSVLENGVKTPVSPGSFLPGKKTRKSLDLVFLTVKSRSVPECVPLLRRVLKETGVVVALQNGTAHTRPLARLGRRVVFASFLAGCDKTAPDQVSAYHHAGLPDVLLHKNLGRAGTLLSVELVLKSASISFSYAKGSLEGMLWTKCLFNAALNPVAALLRKRNGEIGNSDPGRALVEMIFKEGKNILRRAKIPLELAGQDPQRFPWHLLSHSAGNRNSMLQDIEAGRATEADQILAPLISLARKKRVSCEKLACLYLIIKRYAEQR